MTEKNFNIIKGQRKKVPLKDLAPNLNVFYQCVVKNVKVIEAADDPDNLKFSEYSKKPGRNPKNKDIVYNAITMGFSEDNSLTLEGLKQLKTLPYSISCISKLKKEAGFTRKRLKKKSKVLLTASNIKKRKDFASEFNRVRQNEIIFLDKCGFKLHESINYDYSPPDTDAVAHFSNSRGKNNCVCALISITGFKNSRRTEGVYNTQKILIFLREYNEKGIFNENIVLVYDNVPFHNVDLVMNFLRTISVTIKILPLYLPDLNPIEFFQLLNHITTE